MSLLRFVGAEIADLHFPVNGFSSPSGYYFWLSLLYNVAWRLRSNRRTIDLPALPYLGDAGRGSIFFDDTDGNHNYKIITTGLATTIRWCETPYNIEALIVVEVTTEKKSISR